MSPALEHNDELGLPWDDMEDGRPARLTRGRDFFQSVQSLNEAAQNAGRRLHKAVRIVPETRGVKVFAWVQVSDYEVTLGDPCPRCSSYDVRRINPQYAECADCKATLALVLPKRDKDDGPPGGPPDKGEEVLNLLLGSGPAATGGPGKLERARARAEKAAAAADSANGGAAAGSEKTKGRAVNPAKLERGRAKAERGEAVGKRPQVKEDTPAQEAESAETVHEPPVREVDPAPVEAAKPARVAKPPAPPGEERPRQKPTGEEPPRQKPTGEDPPGQAPPDEAGTQELRTRPGKRFFNEHAGLDSGALVSEDGDPLDEIGADEECRIVVSLDVVTVQMQARAVVALLGEGRLRYRVTQPEPFVTRRPGPHHVIVRIPPSLIRPGRYSARLGMQLIHDGELSRLIRGDAFAFDVVATDLETQEPEPEQAVDADGQEGAPDFIELEGSWSVRRGGKAGLGGGRGQ